MGQITWFHDGVKVADGGKFQVVSKEENEYTIDCQLFLKNVTVEDAGKYRVTARNDLGESNATISLNFDSDEAPLPQGGVKPTFTERPVIRQSDEGSKIIFECRLVGEPVPEVSWFHNDKTLSESGRHKFTMQLDEKLYHLCRLEINNVDSADAGCYKAVAKNASGEGQATINLTFEEGTKTKIPDGIPPRFPKKPTIRQEGDNLLMECLLEAHPMPDITWFRKDQKITENSRISYECMKAKKHRFLLTLTIKNPTLADGGMYRCNAFNPFGDSNANIDLNFESGAENGADEPAKLGGPAAVAAAEDGIPPTFTEKPKIIPNESGTLVTMKFRVRAKPKAEMQWYKGNQKIHEDSKFKSKYIELGNDEYEVLLEILKPTADDDGDYKCVVKNDLGQLQAKLNLNIEAEPATPTPAATVVGAPTFTEKPKVETLEGGKRVQMIVRYKAEAQCECQWFFKETKVVESTTTTVIHEKRESYYECRLEMTETTQEHAGIYKCIVKNEQGEINANLTLNIQVAPEDQVDSTVERKESLVTRKTSQTTVMEQTSITSTKRRKSVILQCKVSGDQDVKVEWAKDGKGIATTEQTRESRYSVERKKSEANENETVVSLEIMEASVEDKGKYDLVAISTEGEKQKQTVVLTEEAIVESLAAQPDEGDGGKKKK